jgi:ribosomal protein S18 acetylase RimI-like enzyme
MKSDYFSIVGPKLNSGTECEMILRQLPEWFGAEQTAREYAVEIDSLPTFIVNVHNQLAGFITLKQQFKESAELYVLGILPQYHHQGLGRAAIETITEYCRSRGVEYLQVKTLSPSKNWPAYESTRAFYFSLGFKPLEEIPSFWGPESPCLQMIKKISS